MEKTYNTHVKVLQHLVAELTNANGRTDFVDEIQVNIEEILMLLNLSSEFKVISAWANNPDFAFTLQQMPNQSNDDWFKAVAKFEVQFAKSVNEYKADTIIKKIWNYFEETEQPSDYTFYIETTDTREDIIKTKLGFPKYFKYFQATHHISYEIKDYYIRTGHFQGYSNDREFHGSNLILFGFKNEKKGWFS